MPMYSCLLCLSSLDKESRPPPATKFSIKAQIVRLYDLLVPQHRSSSPHQTILAEIEDSDGFNLCPNCFLSAKEIEKIKQQVAQLEEQIAKKVKELKKTVSNSFQEDANLEESLQKIRKSLLSSEDQETDRILTGFEVKRDPEENLMANFEEQSPPQEDDLPCPSPTLPNQSDNDKDDPLCRLDEKADEISDDDSTTSNDSDSDDSDFCITPDNGKNTGNEQTKSDPDDVSSSSRKRRRIRNDEIKPVVCTVCRARFANQDFLEKHSAVHATSWKCDFCGVTLAEKRSWIRHVRIHTGEKPVKCDNCEESFVDERTKKQHFIRHHTSEQHNCSLCGKGFPLKHSLTRHVQKVHENRKRYECSQCGEKFKTGPALKSHDIREHNADPLVCDECGATFMGEDGLKTHKVTHTGIKKHECGICGTRFFNQRGLTHHMISHSDVRNHICHTCGAGFKTKQNLDRHLTKVHKPTEEKTQKPGGLRIKGNAKTATS